MACDSDEENSPVEPHLDVFFREGNEAAFNHVSYNQQRIKAEEADEMFKNQLQETGTFRTGTSFPNNLSLRLAKASSGDILVLNGELGDLQFGHVSNQTELIGCKLDSIKQVNGLAGAMYFSKSNSQGVARSIIRYEVIGGRDNFRTNTDLPYVVRFEVREQIQVNSDTWSSEIWYSYQVSAKN